MFTNRYMITDPVCIYFCSYLKLFLIIFYTFTAYKPNWCIFNLNFELDFYFLVINVYFCDHNNVLYLTDT